MHLATVPPPEKSQSSKFVAWGKSCSGRPRPPAFVGLVVVALLAPWFLRPIGLLRPQAGSGERGRGRRLEVALGRKGGVELQVRVLREERTVHRTEQTEEKKERSEQYGQGQLSSVEESSQSVQQAKQGRQERRKKEKR